ncbi:ribosome small subunit-dependent GTPase A [uncultured Veillonella sp.]|uniref:ribosome small subunit-dependent GTPase A n=1 Tax=uncultured Veillonella sp. TaxID=159268 RepID=UPI0025FBA6B7|nr:ribosome small subunit-dependent GTPase A [uncultured Veillonella sp.]MDY3973046.1 ribosome small subunit-dependent GTPase A [Veillonella caviae]
MNTGIVIKNVNGYFYVQDDLGTVHECKVRGRLKQKRYSLLVGDRVTYTVDGTIEEILPRHNQLKRPFVANLDQVILVVAAHEPDINELLLNKLLVMIEHADIPLILCINKWDLHTEENEALVRLYEQAGYEVIMASTFTGEGIDELKSKLTGKVSAFAGPSGVGKSSLLNAIEPKFQFQTGEVSDKIKRGRHTTRHASLYSIDEHSFIMDTPGFSALDFSDISEERLTSLYPEFAEYEEQCKFSPCYHEHEPICGIKNAVDEGQIAKTRYESYLTIREEIKSQRKW